MTINEMNELKSRIRNYEIEANYWKEMLDRLNNSTTVCEYRKLSLRKEYRKQYIEYKNLADSLKRKLYKW